jgi:uncharacterized protein YqeY
MSGLAEQLQADLTEAMKARDELRLSVLRMALTAMKSEQVAGGAARELTEDDVLKVLVREAKKRRESAQAYDDAARPELADRERAEGEVLAAYLPAAMPDEELAELVRTAITEAGAATPAQLGQVMKAVTPRVAGRADGARVAAEVRRQLAG